MAWIGGEHMPHPGDWHGGTGGGAGTAPQAPVPTAGLHGGTSPHHGRASTACARAFGTYLSHATLVFRQPAGNHFPSPAWEVSVSPTPHGIEMLQLHNEAAMLR